MKYKLNITSKIFTPALKGDYQIIFELPKAPFRAGGETSNQ